MSKVETVREKCILLVDSANGHYVAEKFVKAFYTDNPTHRLVDSEENSIGSKDEHKFILECLDDASNTENRYYDDAWCTILDSVYLSRLIDNDMDTELYSLHQDGDLWAIPVQDVAELSEEEQDEFWGMFQN